jgi:hypothetical protein
MSWLVAAVVALGLCVVVPAPGFAAPAKAGALTASPTRAQAGQKVKFTGRVPPHRARRVVLERQRGRSWVAVDRRRTFRSGKFVFTIKARARTTSYRVRAPRTTIRGHRYRAVQTPHRKVITFTSTAGRRFVTAVSGSGRYFLDQHGDPIMLRGDTTWGLVFNAGRWGGGSTWRSDIDGYISARAAQGFNTVYVAALGNTINAGRYDSGATWDGISPWVGGSTTDIGPNVGTLNDGYWKRVDYLLDAANAAGITVMLDVIYGDDIGENARPGAMWDGSLPTNAQMTTYGQMLGARYQSYPNIIWMIGGDYFGNADAKVALTLNAIKAAGATQLVSVENYDPSTSYSTGLGRNHAQWSDIYSYAPTYRYCEKAWNESPTIPLVWIDGYYDKNSGASNNLLYRQEVGWALTSGSQGSMYAEEGLWEWSSGALDMTKHPSPAARHAVTAWNAVSALPGWNTLVPDIGSGAVLTGDRGTKITSDSAYTSPTNDYLTGSITPDGTLALIYLPRGGTAHVTWANLGTQGRTAKWLDPTTGKLSSAGAGATSYTTPGNNAAGQPDWYLVLRASG